MCCSTEKAIRNMLTLVVACWLPTVCELPICSTWTSSLCGAVKLCFIKNLEAFGKLTTHLTAVFFGYVQGLIIQDLWLPLRGFSQRDRFPETNLLEAMLMVHSLTVYFQRLDALDYLIWPQTSLPYVIKQTTAKWVASTPLFLFTIAKAIPTVNFQCACFG